MWLLLNCMHPSLPFWFFWDVTGYPLHKFQRALFPCWCCLNLLWDRFLRLWRQSCGSQSYAEDNRFKLCAFLSMKWSPSVQNYEVGDQKQLTMEALLFEQIIRTPKKEKRLNSGQKVVFCSSPQNIERKFLLSMLLAFQGDVQRHQNPHLIWL